MIIQIIFIVIFAPYCISIGIQTNFNGSTSESITNYNIDIGSCPCNLLASACDNYCCCDSSCSMTVVTGWISTGNCLLSGSTPVEIYCTNIQNMKLSSFQDLGCVYFSNRGSIGYFHSLPQIASIVYPTVQRYGFKNSNIPQFQLSIPIETVAYKVQSYINYNNGGVPALLKLNLPFGGPYCSPSVIKIISPTISSCKMLVNANNCEKINSYLPQLLQICKTANCNDKTPIQNISLSLKNGSFCINVINQFSITITLASNGTTYSINSVSYDNISIENIDMTKINLVNVKTIVNIKYSNNTVSLSGNPGYKNGLSLYSNTNSLFLLSPIIDSNNFDQCYLLENITTQINSSQIKFNQQKVYTCKFTLNPCTNPLVIDSLFTNNLSILKYATGKDLINVTGIGPLSSFCNQRITILNIFYSVSGWNLQLQNYIVSAEVTTKASFNPLSNTKSLIINWIYVDPSTINSPPQNYFYLYWSLLWVPLKNSLSKLLWNQNLFISITLIIYLILIN